MIKTTDIILEELHAYANPKAKLTQMVKKANTSLLQKGCMKRTVTCQDICLPGVGTFTYRDVPTAAFPLELRIQREGSYFYRIASPEKALCDELYTMAPVSNTQELAAMLSDDFRMDESDLKTLDAEMSAVIDQMLKSYNVENMYDRKNA